MTQANSSASWLVPCQLLSLAVFNWLLFSLVALGVEWKGQVVEFDRWCAAVLRDHAAEHPLILRFFRHITRLGGVENLCLFNAFCVVVLILARQWRLALIWGCVAFSGAALNATLKEIFDRPRPEMILRDQAARETDESFPSGHTMGVTLLFGLIGYAGWQYLGRRPWRWLLVAACLLLVLLVGFSRMYLRAHYFSDVLGAFLAGTGWLGLWLAAEQGLRVRAARAQTAGG